MVRLTRERLTFVQHDLGSTWHVVDYNETTGKVLRKRTAQGYSDNSTWARGQAWALYGFANSEQCRSLHQVMSTVLR